ncbi:MAG: XdhC family protein [Aggregatilineales bacterium]
MTDETAIYKAALEAQERGQAAALATVIRVVGSVPRHTGSKMLVWLDGRIIGTVGGGALEARIVKDAQAAMADGQTRIVSYTLNDLRDGDPGVCGGTVEAFIEPLQITPTLLVIGCGHVGKALAELGKWVGYRVLVSDDRPEFCNAAHIPNMDGYIVCAPGEVPSRVSIDQHTYVAAVTRGLPVDVDLIPALLNTPAPYVGLIGSRRRWALTAKALEEKSITREQLTRLHAPIGLELQAETPQEIAVSILAEITMTRRGGDGRPMRWLGEG